MSKKKSRGPNKSRTVKELEELKPKALEKLRMNEFNLTATAEEFGISRVTMRAWARSAGLLQEREEKKKVELKVFDQGENDIIIDKVALSKRLFKMKNNILDRLEKTVPKCKNVNTLSRALSIVSEVEQVNDSQGDVGNLLSKTKNFVQVINQIQLNKNESDS